MERTFVTWGSGSTAMLSWGDRMMFTDSCREFFCDAVQGVAAVENLFRTCSSNLDPYVEKALPIVVGLYGTPLTDGEWGLVKRFAAFGRLCANEAYERAAETVNCRLKTCGECPVIAGRIRALKPEASK